MPAGVRSPPPTAAAEQDTFFVTDPKLKIAVFIDFDNIEIGVKTTLGGHFDVGAVLEAIKERGEVVTKVAYSDWKRAGDHSRLLSQHAIRMVQRNLTPGGDKNGADINLALDALEMAFTHDHINAFVIVGGDSDFITLVEKLKQYDRKVFVVGGRQFTSLVMQKNCHEFIAYENLVGHTRRSAGPGRHKPGAVGAQDVGKAVPLVKRALKVLADREVTPQLGLLKSTLLQLDSTFSERDYGAGTFRDFIEKVAAKGIVSLRQSGRSVLVELTEEGEADTDSHDGSEATEPAVEAAAPPKPEPAAKPEPAPKPEAVHAHENGDRGSGNGRTELTEEQAAEIVADTARLFARAKNPPRWPMYVRQVRQYLRGVDETFDERKLGFGGILDFLRACQREGLLRLERDRQGVLRVHAGPQLAQPAPPPEPEEEAAAAPAVALPSEPAPEPVVNGEPVVVPEAAAVIVDAEVAPADDTPEAPAESARAAEASTEADGDAGADAEAKAAAPAAKKTTRKRATTTKRTTKAAGTTKPRTTRARKTAKTA